MILTIFSSLTTKAQSCGGEEKFIDICNKLIRIDSVEFKNKFVKPYKFPKTKKYKKIKGTITVSTKVGVEKFTDDWRPAEYTVHYVLGEDTIMHWVIIVASYYHDDDVYIINTETGKVFEVLCLPQFYQNKIICWQRLSDSPDEIHVLEFKNSEIVNDKYFKICNCSANFWGIQKMYYSNKTLYFKDGKNNYFKANIDF